MTVGARLPVRRGLALLYTAQAVAAVGMAAGGAAGGLLATAVTRSASTAVLPLSAVVLGATVAVVPVGAAMRRHGRRAGLFLGLLAGAVGAVIVLLGAHRGALPMILAGHVLLGGGNTAVMFGRYAAADLVSAGERTRAVAAALTAASVGAVLGPNLLAPAGRLAEAVGLPAPAGLYAVAIPAFVVAAALVLSLPSPSSLPVEPRPGRAPVVSGALPRSPILVLGTANATMVTMMAVVPSTLHHHGAGLGNLGVLVSLHVAGMFGFSVVSGRLCERWSAPAVAAAGATLSALAVVGTTAPVGGAVSAGSLVLLGIAWNLQLVSGTVLLLTGVPQSVRRRIEDIGELVMGTAAVAATLLAVPLLDVAGLPKLTLAAVLLNLVTAAAVRRSAGGGR